MALLKGSHLAVKPGQIYDQLTILEFAGGTKDKKSWWCQCICGTRLRRTQRFLRNGEGLKCCSLCLPKRKAWNKHDLKVGDKLGKLTIVEELGYKKEGGGALYRCECVCGRERVISAYHIVKTTGKVLTCGKRGCREPSWNSRYVGEIGGTFWYRVREKAEIRGIKVLITKEEAWQLFLQQNGKCALTGVELSFKDQYANTSGNASLDRIDSDGDYVLGNVQWVHKVINKMKQEYSQEDFIFWCNLVSEKNKNASSTLQTA